MAAGRNQAAKPRQERRLRWGSEGTAWALPGEACGWEGSAQAQCDGAALLGTSGPEVGSTALMGTRTVPDIPRPPRLGRLHI